MDAKDQQEGMQLETGPKNPDGTQSPDKGTGQDPDHDPTDRPPRTEDTPGMGRTSQAEREAVEAAEAHTRRTGRHPDAGGA